MILFPEKKAEKTMEIAYYNYTPIILIESLYYALGHFMKILNIKCQSITCNKFIWCDIMMKSISQTEKMCVDMRNIVTILQ